MVKVDDINKFIGHGSGSGYGDGYGHGHGYGYGYGSGYGDGSGRGSGYGKGAGYGYGDGSGDGSGYGRGSGYGKGSGDGKGFGSGYGDGDGDAVKTINGMCVFMVDNIPTIITNIRGDIARGFILNIDLSLTPCFIIKNGYKFAHGYTLHEAFFSLQEKLHKDSTEEERISKFKEKFQDFSKKYSARDLFVWHNILTGSCRMGRENFCKNKGIDINKEHLTVYEFIELTKDSYGGDIIKKLL